MSEGASRDACWVLMGTKRGHRREPTLVPVLGLLVLLDAGDGAGLDASGRLEDKNERRYQSADETRAGDERRDEK